MYIRYKMNAHASGGSGFRATYTVEDSGEMVHNNAFESNKIKSNVAINF